MQGKSHVAFALAGAITINNLCYRLFPHQLSETIDPLFHAIGQPWTFNQLAHLWQTQQFLSLDVVDTFGRKVTFFCLLILFARFPDRLERRGGTSTMTLSSATTLPVKHRGFTHSCFLVFLLAFLGVGLWYFLWHYFQQHPLLISQPVRDFLIREAFVAALGVLLAIVLHIVADSLTTQGVKVFWPDETHYGLLPKSLRFSNDTWPEYIVLWTIIFLIGGLVFIGFFGI